MHVLQMQRDKVGTDLKAVLGLGATLALRRLDGSIVEQHMDRRLLLLVLLCELPNGPAGGFLLALAVMQKGYEAQTSFVKAALLTTVDFGCCKLKCV